MLPARFDDLVDARKREGVFRAVSDIHLGYSYKEG
jgi:hypothetical protein